MSLFCVMDGCLLRVESVFFFRIFLRLSILFVVVILSFLITVFV